jgi:hypothetical protein
MLKIVINCIITRYKHPDYVLFIHIGALRKVLTIEISYRRTANTRSSVVRNVRERFDFEGQM